MLDLAQTVTHVSLCSGYGGIDLGLKRAIPNLRTIAYSEIEGFAVANLVSKMEKGFLDPAPVWTNLKTFPWRKFRGCVDILSGGYPCQPFSAAGKRLGEEDDRHLWSFIATGISVCRPRVCFFENVEGHITLGLSTVVSDLEELGYSVSWGIFSASEVGAPHQRKRIFILAYSNDKGLEGVRKCGSTKRWETQTRYAGGSCGLWPSRPGEQQYGWEPPRIVVDAESKREQLGQQLCSTKCGQRRPLPFEPKPASKSSGNSAIESRQLGNTGLLGSQINKQQSTRVVESSKTVANSDGASSGSIRQYCGELGLHPKGGANRGSQSGCERPKNRNGQAQSSLGGDSHGSAGGLDNADLYISCDNRTDELRLLGNGVVPHVAEKAFVTLIGEQNNA
jgi:DNA (cytosine-5)-methyltransferase 1